MKKRILAIIMIMAMCLALCACGGGNSSAKASIVDNDGNSVSLSAVELSKLYDENSASYKDKYQGAEATISGTVDNVSTNFEKFGTTSKSVYVIKLKEGWKITLLEEFHDEVLDLSSGSKVTVTSHLQLCSGQQVSMMDIGQHFGWHDDTIITIQ